MNIKPDEFERILQRKFAFEKSSSNRSSDHRWYQLNLPGRPTISTKVSHSRKPIGKKLWGKIARQLLVSVPYLNGMVECTNSKEDYEEKVRDNPDRTFSRFGG